MISVTRASRADLSLIRCMAETAFPATYREILSTEQLAYMMEWMYSPESLKRQTEIEGHRYFIAHINGEAAGYASFSQQDAHLFHLHKLYVLPRFQGRGIGRRLITAVIDAVRKVHPAPCRIELNVNRQNPAVGFYEHIGLRKLRSGDFPIGRGFYMNDYIMGMELSGS